ncbi:MAG: hypothetical protein PHS37_10050 [Candidatus Omnitrophica bacterium]|nr:hypothetical protein [Candidatus Omnitrophota bacterium]
MIEILAALITSFAGMAVHYVVIRSGIIPIDPDSSIRKLKRHWQILLAVWILLLPLFLYCRAYLYANGCLAALDRSVWCVALAGSAFVAMLFFVYLTFYYVVDRSITTRLMMEIDRSPDKKLTFEEIVRVYDLDTKSRNEIQGIVDGGFMRREGDYYVNTAKGVLVARITAWYKKAFKLGPGG